MKEGEATIVYSHCFSKGSEEIKRFWSETTGVKVRMSEDTSGHLIIEIPNDSRSGTDSKA